MTRDEHLAEAMRLAKKLRELNPVIDRLLRTHASPPRRWWQFWRPRA